MDKDQLKQELLIISQQAGYAKSMLIHLSVDPEQTSDKFKAIEERLADIDKRASELYMMV